MTGKFELYVDRSGGFRFRLKSGSGEILVVSEPFPSKDAALRGIASVQKNAPGAAITELS